MSSRKRAIDRLRPGNPIHEAAAIVALVRRRVVPPAKLPPFVEEFGSAVALLQQQETDRLFAPERPIHQFIGAVDDEELAVAVAEVKAWVEDGRDLRTVLNEDYPAPLRAVFNHPPFLFLSGTWDRERDPTSVAVVGARSASDAGLRRARRLTAELAEAGLTIVSGLAAGIDTVAHETALAARGRTVAVMGTGIDRRFPAGNADLADRIVRSGGALISQFFPRQPPTQWTFPERNVTTSGLALATIVIEASHTSGARMQARIALEHGRTVFLLRSLVEEHEWARRYVEEGAYGTYAIELTSPVDVLDRLFPPDDQPTILHAASA